MSRVPVLPKLEGAPLFFNKGYNEAQQILEIIFRREDYLLQSSSFDHYYEKFSKFFYAGQNGEKTHEDENILLDIIEKVSNLLFERFEQTKIVEFPIFCFAYRMVLNYLAVKTLDNPYLKTLREDYSLIKEVFINSENFDNSQNFETSKKYEVIINYIYSIYYNVLPFFGNNCVYGVNVFLGIYFFIKSTLVAHGFECFPVHEGSFKDDSRSFTIHDYLHSYHVNSFNNIFGFEYLREIYLELLSIQDLGLIYYFYVMMHETDRANYEGKEEINSLSNELFLYILFKDLYENFTTILMLKYGKKSDLKRKIEEYEEDNFSELKNFCLKLDVDESKFLVVPEELKVEIISLFKDLEIYETINSIYFDFIFKSSYYLYDKFNKIIEKIPKSIIS